MNKRPSLYKRQLLVERSIQLPLLMYSLVMATAGVALAALISSYYASFFPMSIPTLTGLVVFVASAVICYGMMILIGLYITNRVAGPLLRMKEHMEAINRGEKPGPLEVRSDDYVNKELIEQYNQLIKKL